MSRELLLQLVAKDAREATKRGLPLTQQLKLDVPDALSEPIARHDFEQFTKNMLALAIEPMRTLGYTNFADIYKVNIEQKQESKKKAWRLLFYVQVKEESKSLYYEGSWCQVLDVQTRKSPVGNYVDHTPVTDAALKLRLMREWKTKEMHELFKDRTPEQMAEHYDVMFWSYEKV